MLARCPTELQISSAFPQNWVQPASSGRIQSGMFGMVRDNETRFHEGIDIKSVQKMGDGAPLDLIYSVAAGTVAHVCDENNGSYGRYVVLRHRVGGLELYTLYAHLSAVSPLLEEGKSVPAGTLLGLMGRTSTVFEISKATAHLHFEIGIALGGNGFDNYMNRKFGRGSNLHGLNNGFNLVGGDPVAFFDLDSQARGNAKIAMKKWFLQQEIAFSTDVPVKTLGNGDNLVAGKNLGNGDNPVAGKTLGNGDNLVAGKNLGNGDNPVAGKNFGNGDNPVAGTQNLPEIFSRVPAIFPKKIVPENVKSWRVFWTWFGMPVKFEPLAVPVESISLNWILPENSPQKKWSKSRKMLDADGNAGENLLNYINIIFDQNFQK